MTTVYLTDAKGKSMAVVDTGDFLITQGFPGTPPETIKHHHDNIAHFKFRSDDIMLLAYPKCGTNWIYEIAMMLLNKSSKPIGSSKLDTMLELQTQEDVHALPSPRVINTHVAYRYLPIDDMKKNQTKTILGVRNPKDALVSYYNMIRGFETCYGYDGEFKDWVQMYMQGKMEYGMYSDYLKTFEKKIKEGTDFPLHVIHYENLKKNGFNEVSKLADFLGLDVSEELKQDIVEQCGFEKMAKNKALPESVTSILTNGFKFYRKGQISDWKNWFTVALSEEFNSYWNYQMSESKFEFTYE